MSSTKDWLNKYVLDYKWSWLFALLLLAVFVVFLRDHINFLFAVFNIIFIYLFFLLVAKIRKKAIFGICFGLLIFLLSFSLTFTIYFSAPLELGNIASILETNSLEIASFDRTIYLIFLVCLFPTIFILKNAISELNSLPSTKKIAMVLISLMFFINLSSIFILNWRNSDFIANYKKDLREQPLQTIYTYSALRLPILYGDIFGLVVYAQEKIDFQRFKNQPKELPEGMTRYNSHDGIPHIYLVLGESAWRNRMSLYNYSLPTTPFLDSISKSDSASLHFYNGIAVANMTRDAIRFSLSFASPRDKNAFWMNKNIVQLANDAGYSTKWISNQGRAGLYDNYPSYIAKSSQTVYFNDNRIKDDLDLFSEFKPNFESDSIVSKFTVIHLMGSHFPYNQRYDETDQSYASVHGIDDDYDKSIYHTDRLLSLLYNYTIKEDSSSIIVYYSDHGASPERGIHGIEGFKQSEYEVPIIILEHNLPESTNSIVSKYIQTIDGKEYINNNNIVYILSELMGYNVESTLIDWALEEGKYVMLPDGKVIPLEGER